MDYGTTSHNVASINVTLFFNVGFWLLAALLALLLPRVPAAGPEAAPSRAATARAWQAPSAIEGGPQSKDFAYLWSARAPRLLSASPL